MKKENHWKTFHRWKHQIPTEPKVWFWPLHSLLKAELVNRIDSILMFLRSFARPTHRRKRTTIRLSKICINLVLKRRRNSSKSFFLWNWSVLRNSSTMWSALSGKHHRNASNRTTNRKFTSLLVTGLPHHTSRDFLKCLSHQTSSTSRRSQSDRKLHSTKECFNLPPRTSRSISLPWSLTKISEYPKCECLKNIVAGISPPFISTN